MATPDTLEKSHEIQPLSAEAFLFMNAMHKEGIARLSISPSGIGVGILSDGKSSTQHEFRFGLQHEDRPYSYLELTDNTTTLQADGYRIFHHAYMYLYDNKMELHLSQSRRISLPDSDEEFDTRTFSPSQMFALTRKALTLARKFAELPVGVREELTRADIAVNYDRVTEGDHADTEGLRQALEKMESFLPQRARRTAGAA